MKKKKGGFFFFFFFGCPKLVLIEATVFLLKRGSANAFEFSAGYSPSLNRLVAQHLRMYPVEPDVMKELLD